MDFVGAVNKAFLTRSDPVLKVFITGMVTKEHTWVNFLGCFTGPQASPSENSEGSYLSLPAYWSCKLWLILWTPFKDCLKCLSILGYLLDEDC